MMRTLASALALVLLGASPALAQGETPLDLPEAVALSKDNSLAAQVSRQQLHQTQADRAAAVSGVLPSVNLSSTAQYSQLPGGGFGSFGGFGNIVGLPTNGTNVDTTISAQQVIFDAFATRDTLLIYDQQLRIAALSISQAEQETMANTAVSYFDVLRNEGLEDVAADTLKQAQEHLRLGNLRLKAGTGTKADVLQLRAQAANAQGQLTQARNAVNLSRMTLANNLNAPVGDRPLVSAPAVPSLPVNLTKDLTAGVERRQEVQEAIAKRDADQTRVSQTSRQLWPTLTAAGQYAQRDLDEGQWNASLKLGWTLFDSFKVRNQMESALAVARADEVQLQQTRQRIALEIRQQYQTRDEARQRVTIAREGLASGQEAYHLALRRYAVGVATIFEVTDVQNTLVQASNNYVQAINDLRVAEVRLVKSMGYDLTTYFAGGKIQAPKAVKEERKPS